MKYKKDWEATQQKFINWWNHKNTGRPLMIVMAKKDDPVPLDPKYEYDFSENFDERYLNAEKIVAHFRNWCENIEFMGESFPNLIADFGPGSVAAYLGCDITFNEKTVWFNEFVEDWEEIAPLKFDPENKWFKKHIELVKACQEASNGDYIVNVPDLMENIDVLASMRGAQDIIFDMMDEPEEVEERIKQVQESYFEYYNRFYDIIKGKDGSSSYTMFSIWGPGKTAKLQCDFSAMMSPQQFRDFIQEPLRQQAKQLDYVLYHLDGPDAIRHVDALMEIDEIDALQWTSGDHGPDGTLEEWDEIYDKVRRAGKSLWIKVYTGTVDDWIKGCDRLVKKYGSDCLYFYFNPMSMADAKKLLAYAEENWRDVKGTFAP